MSVIIKKCNDIVIESYKFSFVGLSLGVDRMCKVAEAEYHNRPIDIVEVLGNGNSATAKRVCNEVVKRLKTLNEEELRLFVTGDYQLQKQMAFLSVCRAYTFIREFVLEVVYSKFFA